MTLEKIVVLLLYYTNSKYRHQLKQAQINLKKELMVPIFDKSSTFFSQILIC